MSVSVPACMVHVHTEKEQMAQYWYQLDVFSTMTCRPVCWGEEGRVYAQWLPRLLNIQHVKVQPNVPTQTPE